MIIWVKEKELDGFLPLIPADMQEQVRSGEYFCLGALPDGTPDEKEKLCAGVLIFSAEDGLSYGQEILTMIRIRWIFVTESEREQGLGNELMEALADILQDNPAEGILVDVPFGSEYDLAEDFFSGWGFDFEVIADKELVISKEDAILRHGSMTKAKELVRGRLKNVHDDIRQLKVIPGDIFRKALNIMVSRSDTLYLINISDDPKDYDQEMSCAVMKDGKISTLILYDRVGEKELRQVLMSSLSDNAVQELMNLLVYCAALYYCKEPDDTVVRIVMDSPKMAELFDHVFIYSEPCLIRRGYFG